MENMCLIIFIITMTTLTSGFIINLPNTYKKSNHPVNVSFKTTENVKEYNNDFDPYEYDSEILKNLYCAYNPNSDWCQPYNPKIIQIGSPVRIMENQTISAEGSFVVSQSTPLSENESTTLIPTVINPMFTNSNTSNSESTFTLPESTIEDQIAISTESTFMVPQSTSSYGNKPTTHISTINPITVYSSSSNSDFSITPTESIIKDQTISTEGSFVVSQITLSHENKSTTPISSINPISTNSNSSNFETILIPTESIITDQIAISTESTSVVSQSTMSHKNKSIYFSIIYPTIIHSNFSDSDTTITPNTMSITEGYKINTEDSSMAPQSTPSSENMPTTHLSTINPVTTVSNFSIPDNTVIPTESIMEDDKNSTESSLVVSHSTPSSENNTTTHISTTNPVTANINSFNPESTLTPTVSILEDHTNSTESTFVVSESTPSYGYKSTTHKLIVDPVTTVSNSSNSESTLTPTESIIEDGTNSTKSTLVVPHSTPSSEINTMSRISTINPSSTDSNLLNSESTFMSPTVSILEDHASSTESSFRVFQSTPSYVHKSTTQISPIDSITTNSNTLLFFLYFHSH